MSAEIAQTKAGYVRINEPVVLSFSQKIDPRSVKLSVKPDYLVCLEDGKKMKMLKRHLKTAYNMTPEQYRQKWGLPNDYPMTSPNYAERRSVLAKQIGLGTKRGIATVAPQASAESKRAAAPRASKSKKAA